MMISNTTLIQWILKEILSKTNNYTFYTRLLHALIHMLESRSTYQVKFCLCVLWHISETSA